MQTTERKMITQTYEGHKKLLDFYLYRGYKIQSKEKDKDNTILVMAKNLWRED